MLPGPRESRVGGGWGASSCGHLPAPVTNRGAPQPRRVTSSCPHRCWGQGGAWHSLAGASSPVLGSAHPSHRWTCSCRGFHAPSPPHPHSVVRLCPCAGPSCLPEPHAGQVMASAKPRGSQRTCPAPAKPGCHPYATDLSCTSPSLSVQSPVLPLLSRSPSETNLASPVEPLAAPVPLRSPTGTGTGRVGTFIALGLPAARWLQAPGAWAGVRDGPGGLLLMLLSLQAQPR